MARTKSPLPLHQPSDRYDERENSASTEEEEDGQQLSDDETVPTTPNIDLKSMEVPDSESDSEDAHCDYRMEPTPKPSLKRSRPETKSSSSKKILGKTGSVEKTTEKKKKKENKKKEKKDERESHVEREGGGDFWSKYPNIAEAIEKMNELEEGGMSLAMKNKLSSIGNEKAKEYDEKWRRLALEKVELDYKTLELMKDQLEFTFQHT